LRYNIFVSGITVRVNAIRVQRILWRAARNNQEYEDNLYAQFHA